MKRVKKLSVNGWFNYEKQIKVGQIIYLNFEPAIVLDIDERNETAYLVIKNYKGDFRISIVKGQDISGQHELNDETGEPISNYGKRYLSALTYQLDGEETNTKDFGKGIVGTIYGYRLNDFQAL